MANINLNTFPYYDDFSSEKGFHKVLFKPGYAVQARELTQLQTILQNQIKRFGNHIFKDGSVVFGCPESTNFKVPFVKILDTDADSNSISNDTLADFEGQVITGSIENVKAVIKKVATGSTTESPNLKTLYLQYTSTGDDNTTTTFANGETLTTENGDTFVVSTTGEGALFSVGEGIVYANGNFIVHQPQTVIVGRYSTTPTAKVGLLVDEEIISSIDDETLLDPAQGSFNYTAPGADRYKLSTILTVVASGDETPEGFYILFDIDAGSIKRKFNLPQYAELNKTLARRTFDESGDYTVRSFPIVVREHLKSSTNNGRYTSGEGGDPGKLVVAVEPGKAYVKGYEHELFSTEYLSIDKAIDTETKQNQAITSYYGSYVVVDTVTGTWPINSINTVDLEDSSTPIGTAKVREIEYIDGTNYKMYLYDIQMSSGSFVDVTDITYSTGNASASIATTPAVLQNTSYSASIFEANYNNVESLADTSYVYRKVITGVSVTSGTLTTSVSGEDWAFTVPTTNDIIIINQASTYDYKTFTAGTVAGNVLTVTGVGGTFSGTVTILALVRKTVTANAKQLYLDRYVKIETASNSGALTGPYILGFYDVVSIEKVWMAESSVSTYPASDPLTTDPDWSDVTSQFTLNNGQKDGYYDLATITPNATLSSNKKILVKLKYFSHGSSSPYYTVDSYPLPAVNVEPTSTEINWYEIPQYTSTGGKVFQLRNCIDFRPTVTLTASDATTISGASVNPAAGSSFMSGFAHPAPTEEIITDLTFHLPRIDRIVLDSEGIFSVIEGVPSLNPVRPRQPDNAMTLGFVNIAPYPSLSPFFAKVLNKQQYACRLSTVDNRRFTMRDIGEIHKRIDRLEYYTSLSLLEQDTANFLITDNAGEDRFKNGILVDSFIGHNVGNVYDAAYNCSISNGELRPFYNLENIDFEYSSSSSGIARKANDAIIVVQTALSSSFTTGSSVSSSSGASGTVKHAVTIATSTTNKYIRLYLNSVSGTFGSGNTITQGAVTGTITYGSLGVSQLPTSLRPDLVVHAENGNLVTLPYTHSVFASNPYASKTRNAVSQLLFTYNGSMRLSPPVDIWTDTNRLPEVQINVGGTADNWEALETAWGTQWGNWETVWQGTNVSTEEILGGGTEITETTTQRRQREGTGIDVTTNTVVNELGNRVVSATLLPFMRSVVVNFRATRMKPNTTVYPFFDGINVATHCRLVGNYSYGDQLVVDANGEVHGQFRIPANTFNVGTKTFILCDNETNPTATDLKTVAIASFTASGLGVTEQNTIISTRVPQITISREVETQDVVSSRTTRITPPVVFENPDPIAQTFFVTGALNGIMLTKLDVFFKTRSSTAPITLEIREVLNGYPTDTIIPFSTVTLSPKDVNVSDDGSAPTEFKFESPVYLKNETEYCFVLLPAGNDENYDVWVSELGQNEIGTTQRIDKQPYAGVLFVSANNRSWTAIQNEDIKFTLYNAEFNVSSAGELIVENTPMDFIKLTGASETFEVGDTIVSDNSGLGTVKYYDDVNDIIKVLVTSGTFVDAEDISAVTALTGTVTTSTSSTTITGTNTVFNDELEAGDILVSAGNIVLGTISSITDNTTLTLTANAGATLSGQAIYIQNKTATIDEIQDKNVTAISPTFGYLDFNNTDIIWEYNIYDASGNPGTYIIMNPEGTTEFIELNKVYSKSNTADTFKIQATLTSENNNISPVIDLEKLGCVIVQNYINNDSSDEDTNSGNAYSKYVSRRVVLDDGQESEDLRVYLTADVPTSASLKVYAKLLNDTDPQAFDDRPWLEMDETLPLTTGGFREYTYNLPVGGTANTEGGRDSGTGVYGYTTDSISYTGFKVFAVKIVLLSSDSTEVPIVRDMRAIALMV